MGDYYTMFTKKTIFFAFVILIGTLCQPMHSAWADDDASDIMSLPSLNKNANLIPPPPTIKANAYILIEAKTGKVIAENESKKRQEPASLTKIMTLYIISNALKNNQIKLDDDVRISQKAWSTGGSKMFVRVGADVKVSDLIQGIIVQSGNDASVAMAEYIAGTEEAFVDLMNNEAKRLGMNDTHFVDCTGMPNEDHYTTPYDLAILSRALVTDFPEYYPWYKQQWFTFNNIKQANRNRLLWRYKYADGIKTGHTESAGYCLAASAIKDDMRLITVVMGAPSDDARAEGTTSLFNYGFRFYKTFKLYGALDQLTETRVWKGAQKVVGVAVANEVYVTIPEGKYTQLKISRSIKQPVVAPITEGQELGTLKISLNDEVLVEQPLVAKYAVAAGGLWDRFSDSISMSVHGFFSKDESEQA